MFLKCRTWSSSDNDQNHHQGWVNVATESVCKAVGWCTSPDGGTPPSPSSSSSSSSPSPSPQASSPSPSPLPSPPPSPQSSSPIHEILPSDGQYEASDSPKKSASTFGQSCSPLSRNQVNKKTYTAFSCDSFLSEFVFWNANAMQCLMWIEWSKRFLRIGFVRSQGMDVVGAVSKKSSAAGFPLLLGTEKVVKLLTRTFLR